MSDLLIELVRRTSLSGQEAPAVRYLVAWMTAHGFDATVDDAGSACGVRGPQDAPHTLMLLGHIDTVPGEIPVRVEDGVLYGRGSVDAKGPLCAFAEAAASAAIPDGWRVVVVGAVEEESATSKGARTVRDCFTPDACIIGEPSGVEHVTLGYKGRLLVDFTLRRPVAHTSRPEPTVGALGAAFWEKVAAWCEAQNEGAERAFDQVLPSLRSINTESDGFHDTVRLTVGFRLPPRLSPEAVRSAIAPFAPADAELRAYGPEQAYQGDKNNALVRAMLAAIRAQGARPGFVLKGGTSDMNVVGPAWNCPIVAYGPGDSALDHTPDEHISLAEYAQGVATLRHVIEHLPAGM
ncbi:MAG TPA: [LysW]-lysine hydrolase [Aggregatilinea sp.]|jgi:LysW-gamma-L-lysine carboxypeptidase|uniref:[LysW]-lysine hydrolase n=1 Tax=Aggregatilinea sp. TaxID=2806333 RepID=UPI002B525074|nr:[LysW]-lysine hydrolase [Aggregatilinea sp.]HML23434.1 [LysW]-lysine hydrolase [Aggregatilinea sp.]